MKKYLFICVLIFYSTSLITAQLKSGSLLKYKNLSDLDDKPTARTNLGVTDTTLSNIDVDSARIKLLINNVTNESKSTMFTDPTFTDTAFADIVKIGEHRHPYGDIRILDVPSPHGDANDNIFSIVRIGANAVMGTNFYYDPADSLLKPIEIDKGSNHIEFGGEGFTWYSYPTNFGSYFTSRQLLKVTCIGAYPYPFGDEPTGCLVQLKTGLYLDMENTASFVGSTTHSPMWVRSDNQTTASLPLSWMERRIKGLGYKTTGIDTAFLGTRMSNDSRPPKLILQKARGTIAVPTTTSSGDTLAIFRADGYDSKKYAKSGEITFEQTNDAYVNNVPSSFNVYLTKYNYSASDIMSGWDLTNWSPNGYATINSTTQWTSSQASGAISKGFSLTTGLTYQIHIAGTFTATQQIKDNGSTTVYATIPSTVTDTTFEFVAVNDGFLFRASAAGTFTYSTLTLTKLGGNGEPVKNFSIDGTTGHAMLTGGYNYAGTDTSSTDAYKVVMPGITEYKTGMQVSFLTGHANTDAATLTINGLTAKTIKKLRDQDLATGDIEATQIVVVIYDGTNWQMTSQLAQ